MTDEDTSPTIVLPIEGMTCGACVSRVEAALRSVPGVTDVAVDLAAGRAIVRSSWVAGIPRIGEAVYRAGYLPGLVSRQYLVTGMNCSTCRTTVELAVRAVRGVVRSEVSLATGRARVESSVTVPTSAIIGAIEKAGYASVAAESAPSVSPGAALASALFRARQFGRRRSREAVAA
jgi:Cu+-exporting ATPase